MTHAHVKYDTQLFDTMCRNIINDFATIDSYIKEIRRCEIEGRSLYGQYTFSYNFIRDENEEQSEKKKELQNLTNDL